MFSSISRRAISTSVKTASNVCNQFRAPVVRSMVTLVEKEMSEEVRYIRQKEREEMKAKLDKILEQDDSSSEKQELAKIIGIFNFIYYF